MMRKYAIVIGILILGFFGFYGFMRMQSNLFDRPWIEYRLIAHALGDIDDIIYTNSLEALDESIQEGYRLIEADILYTSDKQLVLRHDWGIDRFKSFEQSYLDDGSGLYIPSLDEFKSQKIHQKYTAMSFMDLLKYMQKHRDFYVVTDSKYLTPEEYIPQFDHMVEEINSVDPKLMNRFIVQFYNPQMYYDLSARYTFNDYIFTIYAVHMTDEEILSFMSENKLKYLTMYEQRINQIFIDSCTALGIETLTHTINDNDTIYGYTTMGLDAFYTDYALPENFREVQ